MFLLGKAALIPCAMLKMSELTYIRYSQGADVMHFASPSINPALYPRIIALVMFGDPGNRGPNVVSVLPEGGITPTFPNPLAQKLKENCAVGDPVSIIINSPNHLHFSNIS
jgi:hypothetical protein